MVIRVSASFTEDHYCDEEERPNTKLANNSLFASRRLCYRKIDTASNVLSLIVLDYYLIKFISDC